VYHLSRDMPRPPELPQEEGFELGAGLRGVDSRLMVIYYYIWTEW